MMDVVEIAERQNCGVICRWIDLYGMLVHFLANRYATTGNILQPVFVDEKRTDGTPES